MHKLFSSTALALVLGFGVAVSIAPPAAAQEIEACSDYGLLDADGDGVLAEEEYSAWADGVFDDWDTDEDRMISEAEFGTCYEAAGWYEGAADEDWEEESDELFTVWDDDDDGLLSEDEFADEEEFAEWDANDDGVVDDQEFLIDDFAF